VKGQDFWVLLFDFSIILVIDCLLAGFLDYFSGLFVVHKFIGWFVDWLLACFVWVCWLFKY